MSFNDFLNQAWSDHANQTLEVASRLEVGIKLIEKNEQIPFLANLITHVMGEHLGQWDQGVYLLEQLGQHPLFESASESANALQRSQASLQIASGQRQTIDELSLSDQIRALAVAASALSEQKNTQKAQMLFQMALEKAQTGISQNDPANRALAATANNMACSLEEKLNRTQAETDLMILAAQTGRKYWEIAGSWLELERAEYRLSQTYLKAGNLSKALIHAQNCLKISEENNAPALELFFGYEVLALVQKAQKNTRGFASALEQAKLHFEKLSDEDKPWCESSLKKLEYL